MLGSSIPKERILHLEALAAPRVGNRDRSDEDWAFEGREYVRAQLVGKTVNFTISHTVNTTNPPLEFGIVTYTKPDGETIDVALETVKAGWARVRENKGADDEEGSRRQILRDAEEEAKVHFPVDPQTFFGVR